MQDLSWEERNTELHFRVNITLLSEQIVEIQSSCHFNRSWTKISRYLRKSNYRVLLQSVSQKGWRGNQSLVIKGFCRKKFKYEAESMLGKTMGKIFFPFQFSVGIILFFSVDTEFKKYRGSICSILFSNHFLPKASGVVSFLCIL